MSAAREPQGSERLELIASVWAAARPALLRWAGSELQEPHWQLEDLYAEAFVRAVRCCRAQEPVAVRAFLRQAVRLVASEQRRRSRDVVMDVEDLAAVMVEEAQAPDHGGEQRRVYDTETAVQAGGEASLEVLSLSVIDGLSRPQIAARTGLSERQVKRYRERAAKGLAASFLQNGYGALCPEISGALQAIAFTSSGSAIALVDAREQIAQHTRACPPCATALARLRRDRVEFRRRLGAVGVGELATCSRAVR